MNQPKMWKSYGVFKEIKLEISGLSNLLICQIPHEAMG